MHETYVLPGTGPSCSNAEVLSHNIEILVSLQVNEESLPALQDVGTAFHRAVTKADSGKVTHFSQGSIEEAPHQNQEKKQISLDRIRKNVQSREATTYFAKRGGDWQHLHNT